jgi:alpha-tubulin suppressor-like RCC1 family protein
MRSSLIHFALCHKSIALLLCAWWVFLFGVILSAWWLPFSIVQANSSSQATLEHRTELLAVSSSISMTDVWGGAVESIALLSNHTVWTWGWNDYGILGNGFGASMFYTGTEYDSWLPIQVLGPNGAGHLTSITAIAGGERHNAALDSNGEVWMWGWNYFGQLGTGTYCTNMNAPDCMGTTPVKIPAFMSVKAIASRGYHTLALKNDGTVWAWGYNDAGRLGDGTNTDRRSPVPVVGLTNTVHGGVIAISGGGDINAALMTDHTLMAWGYNEFGAVGNGTTSTIGQWTPTEVSQSTGLTNVKMIATGWDHMVALDANGNVWTWGNNSAGQLGDGTTISSSVPIKVNGLGSIISVSAGDGSTVVLKSDGTVWAWGLIRHGDGSNYSYGPTPVQVAGIDQVVLVRARDWHVLAIKDDGTAWAWGSNQRGECGNGAVGGNTDTPVRVLFNFSTTPTIASASIATGTVGVPFSYTVLATGTLPITFTVTGLPAWADFNSPTISGTPNISGTFPVTLTATNDIGRDTRRLTIFIGQFYNVYLPLIVR